MPSNAVERTYHSTSLLLPDGRVLHTGSGEGSDMPAERNAELYSPPYLFKGPRPTIADAPSLVGYGTSFTVETPEAAEIAKVSLIRLGSVTHSFDMNQRFLSLPFTPASAVSTCHGADERESGTAGSLHALPGERERRALRGQDREGRRVRRHAAGQHAAFGFLPLRLQAVRLQLYRTEAAIPTATSPVGLGISATARRRRRAIRTTATPTPARIPCS